MTRLRVTETEWQEKLVGFGSDGGKNNGVITLLRRLQPAVPPRNPTAWTQVIMADVNVIMADVNVIMIMADENVIMAHVECDYGSCECDYGGCECDYGRRECDYG